MKRGNSHTCLFAHLSKIQTHTSTISCKQKLLKDVWSSKKSVSSSKCNTIIHAQIVDRDSSQPNLWLVAKQLKAEKENVCAMRIKSVARACLLVNR